MYPLHLLAALALLSSAGAFRILGFLPFPAKSHHNVMAPLLHALAHRGNKVVYLTPVEPPQKHTNLDVRLIKPFIKEYLEYLDIANFGAHTGAKMSWKLGEAAEAMAGFMYGDPVAQELIHGNETFDACIMEAFTQEPVSALLHKFGCVGIEISTFGDIAWLNELSGLPNNPAYQIDFKAELTDTMTFWEKLYNTYLLWATLGVNYYYLWRSQAVMDKYFDYTGWESRPPINQLVTNRSLVLINQALVLGYAQPMAPHVKIITNLGIVNNKPLPENIKKFMNGAPDEVIYFSLGSNLNTSEIMAGPMGQAFKKVFSELPRHRVLMKWEADIPGDFPQNVMLSKWLPQQDVLSHPKCNLFVTHGGYNSLSEAIFRGVPVLGIPFFGDQPKNIRQVDHFGFGIGLHYNNVTYESLKWAFNELINNPRYKKEAMRLMHIKRSGLSLGLYHAAMFVENATRHPNALTPKSAFLNFFQLHCLDIYCFVGLCGWLFIKSLCLLLRVFFKSAKVDNINSAKKNQ